ncbi:FkbM family methyltransferase [Luteitalea sp. TBR-22]|uniref:FkbM family methyltransferase n=1 Tax=Luteitalea sp. TBR-22 TaxID=2802971 RepID=UPI001EF61751|nr:FkbM family methyltransferase [Luteitalea sp. TBR-22]
MTERPRLVVVDGGARGGWHLLPGVQAHLEVHAFEPDPVACAALVSTRDDMTLRAWPWALDAADGRRTLHLARHPSMSSLLAPDLEAYARHFGRMLDYPAWARAIETVATCEVETIALDTWARQAGVRRVHLLKLDTQGTELDILRGAHGLLGSGDVAVVYCEVSFLPVYRGQALFPEVHRFMRDTGFSLVDCHFHPHRRMGHHLGARYAEPPRWTAVGDAVFAWRPECWDASDRVDLAAAGARVLAHLGQPRTAATWLARHAGLSRRDVDFALAAWTASARRHAALPRRALRWLRRRSA